ncbi:hypothetical protein C0J52_10046 [Blattella germanica]|nr:hypothetical protein C0J52_10046 [Blattella germanica]
MEHVIPRWVRVNTLMISVAEALECFENEGWQLVPSEAINDYRAFLEKVSRLAKGQFMVDFHIKALLAFPSKTEFFSHELYLNGSIVLQDKASCLSSWILNPAPGSVTLDMCAAPGTKTTHLAALMENKGRQNAYDKSRLRKLAMFQFKLLTRALTCFPDVKRVVYSTCSIEPEENEAVVEQVLDFVNRDPEKPNFELADNILEGNWINYGSSDYSVGPKCVYALPDVDLTNGFFVAHFVRVGGAGGHENIDRSKTKKKKTKKNEALPKTQDDDNDSLKKTENEESDNESRRCEKKRKRKKKTSDESNLEDGGNNRLEVENLDSPKKKKKKKHHRSETEAEEEMAHLDGKFETQLIDVGESKGQIKKKHKKRKMSI